MVKNIQDAETIQLLENMLPQLLKKFDIVGLSIVIIRNAELIWNLGIGYKNKKEKTLITTETVFEAASLSKPFVAVLALKAVEEGKLDLDKPMIDYLPSPYLNNQPLQKYITAKHVLTHTTGFPNRGKISGSPQIYFTPGERFSYSGEGFMYLQKILENIYNQSLEELLQEKIIKPLKIPRASFLWNDDIENFSAQGYLKNGLPKKKWKPTEPVAASSLHISPSGYAQFIISLMEKSSKENCLLSQKSIDEMFKPWIPVNNAGLNNKHDIPKSKIIEHDRAFWGLGWGLEKNENDLNFWHWGDNDSFLNLVIVDRKEKSGFILMSNSERSIFAWKEIINIAFKGEHQGFDWLMQFYK